MTFIFAGYINNDGLKPCIIGASRNHTCFGQDFEAMKAAANASIEAARKAKSEARTEEERDAAEEAEFKALRGDRDGPTLIAAPLFKV